MRRIAFYSYDEHGLGHVRRSIAIAHTLSAAEPVSILLIAGAREAALFRLPDGTDTFALPAPSTDFNGERRGPSIGLAMAGPLRMRPPPLRRAVVRARHGRHAAAARARAAQRARRLPARRADRRPPPARRVRRARLEP